MKLVVHSTLVLALCVFACGTSSSSSKQDDKPICDSNNVCTLTKRTGSFSGEDTTIDHADLIWHVQTDFFCQLKLHVDAISLSESCDFIYIGKSINFSIDSYPLFITNLTRDKWISVASHEAYIIPFASVEEPTYTFYYECETDIIDALPMRDLDEPTLAIPGRVLELCLMNMTNNTASEFLYDEQNSQREFLESVETMAKKKCKYLDVVSDLNGGECQRQVYTAVLNYPLYAKTDCKGKGTVEALTTYCVCFNVSVRYGDGGDHDHYINHEHLDKLFSKYMREGDGTTYLFIIYRPLNMIPFYVTAIVVFVLGIVFTLFPYLRCYSLANRMKFQTPDEEVVPGDTIDVQMFPQIMENVAYDKNYDDSNYYNEIICPPATSKGEDEDEGGIDNAAYEANEEDDFDKPPPMVPTTIYTPALRITSGALKGRLYVPASYTRKDLITITEDEDTQTIRSRSDTAESNEYAEIRDITGPDQETKL